MRTLLFLLLTLPLYGQVERIGTIPGCICTDIVVLEEDHLLISCKEGVVFYWTPSGRDTIAQVDVETSGESGLLGVTLINDKLYLQYVDHNFDQHIVSVHNLTIDTILSVYSLTNFPNHRGGDLDTDGTHIYASIGEGPGDDGYVLILDTLGNILSEAHGLRNPWKIHVAQNNLWITDVGDQDREEVNLIPIDSLDGTHFNWPCFEGTVQLGLDTCGGIDPYFEYPRVGGTAIIGGYLSDQGYVFADHYDPNTYLLNEGVDTLPGVRYLSVLDDGYAAGYDGRIYRVSFTTHQNNSISFVGPDVCEFDSINPFMDYRLDILFTSGSDSILIPGYFAADGDAANSSAKCGNTWRVNYNLTVGQWNYQVLFSQGDQVAINGHSQDTLFPHGLTGQITSTNFTQLQNVGTRYRRWNDGEWFLKFGTDSPETLFAYEEFDGTYQQFGFSNLLDYSEHLEDWNTGDPVWQDSLGKGLIGAINYLSEEGQNAFSCVVMNINGDGKNCWPFVSHDTLNRYDVSKLAQWGIVLSHAGEKRMHWQVKMGEFENHTLLSNDQWKLMFRELIARFGHLPAITWNLGEEFLFTGFDQQLVARSNYIREIDPYGHLLVFHNLTVLGTIFNNLFVREYIDGASLQIGELSWTDSLVAEIRSFNSDTVFIISNDEQGPSIYGVPADQDSLPQTLEQVRRINQYPAFFGGVEGWEAYYGYNTSCTDLNCDDFRSRGQTWYTNRGLNEVLRTIDFQYSHPHPELVDTGYCFGSPSGYLVYGFYPVDFLDTGDFTVRYFDVLTHVWTNEEPLVDLLPPFDEWVALIRPQIILGTDVWEFQILKRGCDAVVRYSLEGNGVIEKTDDFHDWKILDYVSFQGEIVDESPSRYYRLSAGGESLLTPFKPCTTPYKVVKGGIEAYEKIKVYLMDGRLIFEGTGFISLPLGYYIVESNVELVK